jgi:hypothetical protein
VSKLRENNKQVIGVGVKQSTSDLLVANCDEFIFYDDLVREVKRAAAKRDERKAQPAANAPKRAPDEGNRRKEELEERKSKAIDMVVEMFDALVSERGDSGKIWASLLKDTLKRRRPDFNETYFGFRTFGNLLEEAQARGMLEFGRDEKSGAYVYRSDRAPSSLSAQVEQMANAAAAITYEPEAASQMDEDEAPKQEQEQAQAQAQEPRRGRGRGGRTDFRAPAVAVPEPEAAQDIEHETAPELVEEVVAQQEPRRRGRGGRTDFRAPVAAHPEAQVHAAPEEAPAAETPEWNDESPFPPPLDEKRRSPRGARKSTARKAESVVEAAPEPLAMPAEPVAHDEAADGPAGKAARKPATRSRRPAKPKAAPENA